MSYTVKIDFQDGQGQHDITNYLLVPKDTMIPVTREKQIYSDLQYTTNSAKFAIGATSESLYADFALMAQAIGTSASWPLIKVEIKKDNTNYFVGYIRSTFKTLIGFTKIERLEIECVDPTFLLAYSSASIGFTWFNYKVCDPADKSHSILHQLFYAADFVDGDLDLSVTRSTAIPAFKVEASKLYSEIVKQLCFEYGVVIYAKDSGIIGLYDLQPASITPTVTIEDGVNILNTYMPEKKEDRYLAIDLGYFKAETKTDAILAMETEGATGSLECSIGLANGEYYPPNTSATQDGNLKYGITDYDILGAYNIHALVLEKTGDVHNTDSWAPGPLDANLRLTSTGGGVITKLNIIGDVIMKKSEGKNYVTYESIPNTVLRDKYDADYIFDDTSADKFGCMMQSYFDNSNMQYKMQVNDLTVDVGDYVTYEDARYGITQISRVVETREGANERWREIVLEGVAPFVLDTPTYRILAGSPGPVASPSVVNTITTTVNTATADLEDDITDNIYTAIYGNDGLDYESIATNTPTIPTLTVCKGIPRGVELQWDRQLNLSNFDHYEVAVSSNQSDWYGLKMDGTDWKDTSVSHTDWPLETLIHPNIPNGGTIDAPTGVTLYYKVRRVTKEPVTSDYCVAVSTTTKTIAAGDLAANSVYANNIVAGTLQTQFANVGGELIVGASYAIGGSPVSGDQKVIVNGNMFASQEYVNGGWSTVTQLGGSDANKSYLQVRAVIKTGADVSATSIGHASPSSTAKIYEFENAATDQNAANPWDTNTGTSYSASTKKFGSYSITGNSGSLIDNDANGMDFGNPWAIDAWINLSALPPITPKKLIELRTAESNTLDVDTATTTSLDGTEYIAQGQSSDGVKLTSERAILAYIRYSGNLIVKLMSLSGKTPAVVNTLDLGAIAQGGNLSICQLSETEVVIAYTSGNFYLIRVYVTNDVLYSGAAADSGVAGPGANRNAVSIVKVDTGKVLVAYKDSSGLLRAICATIATDTFTFGSSVSVYSTNTNSSKSLAPLTTDKAVVLYIDTITQKAYGNVLTTSGTTVTVNAQYAFDSSNTYGGFVQACGLSATSFAFSIGASAAATYAVAATVSGTAITFGTRASIGAYNNNTGNNNTTAFSSTAFAAAVYNGTSQPYVVAVTVSGTTCTVGTTVQLTTDADNRFSIFTLDNCRLLAVYSKITATQYIKACALFMRGTNFTLYSIATGLRFCWFNSQGPIGRIDSDYAISAGSWYHISANNDYANKKIYFTCMDTEASHTYTTETLVTTATTLTITFPETAYAIFLDDLLLLADVYLDRTTASRAHATTYALYNWVDYAVGVDGLLDLFISAKSSSGKIKVLSNALVNGSLAITGTTQLAGALDAGTTNPSHTTRLNYDGYLYATQFNTTSTRAIKENIRVCRNDALGLINDVDIVTYHLKEDEEREQHFGFIAEDTHEVFTGRDHDKMRMSDTIALLMKAVQELSQELEILKHGN